MHSTVGAVDGAGETVGCWAEELDGKRETDGLEVTPFLLFPFFPFLLFPPLPILLGALEIVGIDVIVGMFVGALLESIDGLSDKLTVGLLDGVLCPAFFPLPLPILVGALEIVGIDVIVGTFDGALVFLCFPPMCSLLGDEDGSKTGD